MNNRPPTLVQPPMDIPLKSLWRSTDKNYPNRVVVVRAVSATHVEIANNPDGRASIIALTSFRKAFRPVEPT